MPVEILEERSFEGKEHENGKGDREDQSSASVARGINSHGLVTRQYKYADSSK